MCQLITLLFCEKGERDEENIVFNGRRLKLGTSTLAMAVLTIVFLLISEGIIRLTKKCGIRRITVPVFWTLLVVSLTIYPVAELMRFINAFYGIFGYWGFVCEFGLMVLGYAAGIFIVFGLALKKL